MYSQAYIQHIKIRLNLIVNVIYSRDNHVHFQVSVYYAGLPVTQRAFGGILSSPALLIGPPRKVKLTLYFSLHSFSYRKQRPLQSVTVRSTARAGLANISGRG